MESEGVRVTFEQGGRRMEGTSGKTENTEDQIGGGTLSSIADKLIWEIAERFV